VEIQVTVEELRKRKIMVCTPMYGAMCTGQYSKSCTDLGIMATNYGVQLLSFQ